MKTVWVVEEGEYSDYRVIGVFTSKENAERVHAYWNSSTRYKITGIGRPAIAEWTLDPAVEELRQGFKQFEIRMEKNGDCKVNAEDSPYDVSPEIRLMESWPDVENQFLRGTVWAKDEHHAAKIANEHRARLIAEGEWK